MSSLLESVIIPTVGSTETAIYTAPLNVVLMSLSFTNLGYGILPISVWVMRGTDRFDIAKNFRITPHQHAEVLASKVTLAGGDVLYVKAPIANQFNGLLTAYRDI